MTCNYCIFNVYLLGISSIVAYDDQSIRKVATQSTTVTGNYDLYKADNAVDRNITTCMRTDVIGSGPQTPDKTVWWKVDRGGVYNIYIVNMLFKNYDGYEKRQQGRFEGFSLFVSRNEVMDFSSLCYKDGHGLPPLNFTTTCITSGRYVEFYNERLDGVTYPDGYEFIHVFMELCEVIVYGCKEGGVYGSNCNESCPNNCINNRCDIQSGHCISCEPGWTGTNCTTECDYGWYGQNCTQRCPGHCRDNVTCDHVTGRCDKGCDAGWTGFNCNHESDYGWYGQNCTHRCSGHCRDNVTCNHVTGRCDKGCDSGWTGFNCNNECDDGKFGFNCAHTCSDQCLNVTSCDKKNGTCEINPNREAAIFSDQVSELCAQDNGQWSVVGPVSLGFNILFTLALIVFIWSVYNKRISMSVQKPPCMKSNLYVETEVTSEDNSHYQELGLSREGNAYQNTTLQ